jgi:hypothetical protein
MTTVLIHHKVKDFSTWKPFFDSAYQFRHDVGEEGYKIFRSLTDPNDVTLLLRFETAERAQKFIASEKLKAKFNESGVIGEPEVQLLAEVMFARRTAAD